MDFLRCDKAFCNHADHGSTPAAGSLSTYMQSDRQGPLRSLGHHALGHALSYVATPECMPALCAIRRTIDDVASTAGAWRDTVVGTQRIKPKRGDGATTLRLLELREAGDRGQMAMFQRRAFAINALRSLDLARR